jgi:protein-arginine kinase activator protein McsA
MQCNKCKKEATITKLFRWKGRRKELCQDCYKPYFKDETKRSQVERWGDEE